MQLAAHNCVLVNRHFLQNFMVKGCWILRDIGSSRHIYSYYYISVWDFMYNIDNCCNFVITAKHIVTLKWQIHFIVKKIHYVNNFWYALHRGVSIPLNPTEPNYFKLHFGFYHIQKSGLMGLKAKIKCRLPTWYSNI